VPRVVLREMGTLGLLGMRYERAWGGSELDTLATVVLAEELGRSTYGGFAITVLVHTDMASPHLHHAGNAAQLAKYMPGITAGRTIAAVGISEPGAGSDVAALKTTAIRDGQHWVLNGTKLFITNGVHADLYFIAARTSPARHGVSMFIVEKGTPGFSVGRSLEKTGWLSSDTAELVFDDCRIPAANLLGERDKGFYAVMKNFQTERIALAAMAVGHSTQALKLTLEHVRDRRAFGGTLFDKQVVRQRLALLDAKVRAARQYMYHCAWLVTQGREVVQDVSMLKALTGELVNEVVLACQQFHGGMGYMRGTAIERLWRDARILAIGGGATEVMLDEAAKRY
jgi:acyl-CoA dehydrogenase